VKVNHRERIGIEDSPVASQLGSIDRDHERVVNGSILRKQIPATNGWIIKDARVVNHGFGNGHCVSCERKRSIIVLFWFSPDLSISVIINLNVDGIGSAADRTVFDIRLTSAFRQVKRDDYLFTTRIADVTGFFLRRGCAVSGRSGCHVPM
jgi:hypothetical protein